MLLACVCLLVCVSAASACSIKVVKTTNGCENPKIIVGDTVTWTYKVTSDAQMKDISVTDPGLTPAYQSGDTNTNGKLDVHETWIYTATGTALEGPQSNIGTVHGTYCGNNHVYSDTDSSSYTGILNPIHINKLTNGADGQDIDFGTTVTWTYTVTNSGDHPLSTIIVTDNVPGVNPAYQSGDTNGNNKLDPTEVWIYTATGTAVLGPYSNTGTVTGKYECECENDGEYHLQCVGDNDNECGCGKDCDDIIATSSDGSSYSGVIAGGSSGSSVPEFPSMALPAAFIVGLVGIVLYVKGNRDNL